MKIFRILALADIHGNIKALKTLISFLTKQKIEIDLIIIAGDLPLTTPIRLMLRFIINHASISKKKYTKWVYKGNGRKIFVNKQIKSVSTILSLFETISAPIVYVSGNVDSFEAQNMLKNWSNSKIHFLNSNEIIFGSLRIRGIGGSLHSSERSDSPLCDMEFNDNDFSNRIDPILESEVIEDSFIDILVTHEPPAFIYSNHKNKIRGGSSAITKLITRIKPNLVIFGHYHEYPLLKREPKKVTYLNPGPLACYYYSLIEINNRNLDISLKRMNPKKIDPINIIYSNRINPNNVKKHFKLVE
ncbi:MAG: metallophosphoesterase [Candidatus Hodarchaeota archaeon]